LDYWWNREDEQMEFAVSLWRENIGVVAVAVPKREE
jgi:hypothetical protein